MEGGTPGGLIFTQNGPGTAALTGAPVAGSGGKYTITMTAASASGTFSRAFVLKVDQRPAITSVDAASAVTGSAFSFQVTHYPAAKITESGTLPRGITYNSAAAAFSGAPKAGTSGSYPISITAKSPAGTVTQDFALTVT